MLPEKLNWLRLKKWRSNNSDNPKRRDQNSCEQQNLRSERQADERPGDSRELQSGACRGQLTGGQASSCSGAGQEGTSSPELVGAQEQRPGSSAGTKSKKRVSYSNSLIQQQQINVGSQSTLDVMGKINDDDEDHHEQQQSDNTSSMNTNNNTSSSGQARQLKSSLKFGGVASRLEGTGPNDAAGTRYNDNNSSSRDQTDACANQDDNNEENKPHSMRSAISAFIRRALSPAPQSPRSKHQQAHTNSHTNSKQSQTFSLHHNHNQQQQQLDQLDCSDAHTKLHHKTSNKKPQSSRKVSKETRTAQPDVDGREQTWPKYCPNETTMSAERDLLCAQDPKDTQRCQLKHQLNPTSNYLTSHQVLETTSTKEASEMQVASDHNANTKEPQGSQKAAGKEQNELPLDKKPNTSKLGSSENNQQSSRIMSESDVNNDKQREARRARTSRSKSTPIAHWPLGKQTISHVGAKQAHSSQEVADLNGASINYDHRKPMSQCIYWEQHQQQRARKLSQKQKPMCFGDAEDLLSPHLAAYTNFQETSKRSQDQQAAFNLSLKTSLFHKHKRPFGRNYEWPTANWIHNSTKPELINLDNPKIPTSFKATILAASKSRRGSYDDQSGDNDINIILAPSDLQNFEKQRYKFNRDSTTTSTSVSPNRPLNIRRSSSTLISSSPIFSPTISKNNIYTLTKTKALLLDQQNLLFLNRSTKGLKTNEQGIIGYEQDTTQQLFDRFNSNNNNNNLIGYHHNNSNQQQSSTTINTLGQLQLAKALLDQDYSLTVQLFIKKSALNWNFNSFTFDAICCGRSLTELSLHLFDYYNLYEIFKLDITNVLKCFRLLEFGYHSSNPYHNSVHAADVTQAMHCFIQEKRIRIHMTDLEILSSIMAAVCHDLDHPGVNQTFLINTKNPLADLYNSESVLENHHWRFALCIFKESNIFDHFEPDIYQQMTEQLKQLILATDIARQNEYLRRFREALATKLAKGTTKQTMKEHDNNTSRLDDQSDIHLDNNDDYSTMRNPELRALVLQIALKCADLGNPCRPWLISRVWSNLICDELFKMGKVERKLGLPLTPICQQEKTSIATIQTDFFRFIVLPLLELWHQFLQSPLSKLLMSNFEHNYQRWQRANRIVQQLRRRKSVASLERIYNSDTDNAQIISLIVMKFYKTK